MLTQELRVFISATTTDLKSYREAVKNILLTADIFPVIQENFPPDYRELIEFLQDKISDCDAVICLVGSTFGAAPKIEAKDQNRSYTQIEYDIARKLDKRVYIFLTTDKFIPDNPSADQPEEFLLQTKHRELLLENHKCEFFTSVEELREKVSQITIKIKPHLPIYYVHPPSPPAFFAGRMEEIAQLNDVIRKRIPSIILVIGIGGQGKTTLVYQWLREKKHLNFSAGLWCTAYRGGYSFDMFLDEALTYFLQGKYDKRNQPDIHDRLNKLIDLLQKQPLLIIIDGVERWLKGWHKTGNEVRLVETIEERSGFFDGLDEFLNQVSGITNGSHIILTTRAIPSALDDTQFTTIPVHEEPERDLSLKGLDPEASVALLRRLGVNANDEQIKKVASSYAHHPLALNVLGRLLYRRYGGRIENLPKISIMDPKRSLFKLFDEIRQNITAGSDAEKILSIASLCFENPNLSALISIMSVSSDSKDELIEQILILEDWNLVNWNSDSETISIHPLVKQYFSDLFNKNELKTIHEKYSAWYLHQNIAQDASTLEQIRALILSLEHAFNAGNTVRCRDLCFLPMIDSYPLVDWVTIWGHQDTGIELLGRLSNSEASSIIKAEYLITRAALLRQLGSLNVAHNELDEAISLLKTAEKNMSNDQLILLAGAYMNRGNVRWQASKLIGAVEDYNLSLQLFNNLSKDNLNRDIQIACVLLNRGIAFREMGNFSKAAIDCDQALKMYRKFVKNGLRDLEQTLIDVLINRGNILADLQQHWAALQNFDEAIKLCQIRIDENHMELIPLKTRARVMKAATLNDAGQIKEALEEADKAIAVLTKLVNSGRRDLEQLLALTYLGRSSSKIKLKMWPEALHDCERTLAFYNRLIENGRDDLIGWKAHALMNRAEAYYALGHRDFSSEDRKNGFKIMRDLIDRGEPETRVLFLSKSVSAAKYLIANKPEESRDLLEKAIAETKQGIAEGNAIEALTIEAQKCLVELNKIEKKLAKAIPANTIIQRFKNFTE